MTGNPGFIDDNGKYVNKTTHHTDDETHVFVPRASGRD